MKVQRGRVDVYTLKSDPEGLAIIKIARATQEDEQYIAAQVREESMEWDDPKVGKVVQRRKPNQEEIKLQRVFRTLKGTENVVWEDGREIFTFHQETGFPHPKQEFIQSWLSLPLDATTEIYDCVCRTNPEWRTATETVDEVASI